MIILHHAITLILMGCGGVAILRAMGLFDDVLLDFLGRPLINGSMELSLFLLIKFNMSYVYLNILVYTCSIRNKQPCGYAKTWLK
ncbi:hypothetical protein ETAC_01400 [Edwardsiella piscicida C07-087]|nr:hypothetical protein ETAC_01400 [Edwardsiella piscicida C07-087]